ncbi:hypothetical protein RRG08_013516 [Elysia crispata]|uniref:Uncharacterized protein n=1 Tax=Elysia crispata TaxID=231223 RepID=A0AAE0Y138_9GAST|nr:hypothetical protein RRG08_013516 [Elysia crispata]
MTKTLSSLAPLSHHNTIALTITLTMTTTLPSSAPLSHHNNTISSHAPPPSPLLQHHLPKLIKKTPSLSLHTTFLKASSAPHCTAAACTPVVRSPPARARHAVKQTDRQTGM